MRRLVLSNAEANCDFERAQVRNPGREGGNVKHVERKRPQQSIHVRFQPPILRGVDACVRPCVRASACWWAGGRVGGRAYICLNECIGSPLLNCSFPLRTAAILFICRLLTVVVVIFFLFRWGHFGLQKACGPERGRSACICDDTCIPALPGQRCLPRGRCRRDRRAQPTPEAPVLQVSKQDDFKLSKVGRGYSVSRDQVAPVRVVRTFSFLCNVLSFLAHTAMCVCVCVVFLLLLL